MGTGTAPRPDHSQLPEVDPLLAFDVDKHEVIECDNRFSRLFLDVLGRIQCCLWMSSACRCLTLAWENKQSRKKEYLPTLYCTVVDSHAWV